MPWSWLYGCRQRCSWPEPARSWSRYRTKARKRGYNASPRIAQANESVAKTIDEIAQEIDAGLVVCGQRGRGAIRSALLGSVSHALAAHTKRPVLIAPQRPS